MKKRPSATGGQTLASNALLFGLVVTLEQRGVLSSEDVNQLFESVLTGLERRRPATPQIRIARQVLEDMAQNLGDHRRRRITAKQPPRATD